MSKDTNKRTVPIADLKTGQARMSEPMPVHAPRQDRESLLAVNSSLDKRVGDALLPASTSVARDPQSATPPLVPQAVAAGNEASVVPTKADAENLADLPERRKSPNSGNQKPPTETLEQLIEYAYGRKGQRVTLRPGAERKVAQNARLDDVALARLLKGAVADMLLAVPLQLLLLSRRIHGYPALRSGLVSFVSTVMLQHPVFSAPGVQAALRNLPDGLPPADALVKVMSFEPASDANSDSPKVGDLNSLRRNAAYLFALWLAITRGLGFDDVVDLLLHGVWLPAGQQLLDDNARLQVLTGIEQSAAVGLACQRLWRRANDARSHQARAVSEAAELRERLSESDAQRKLAEDQRDALRADLQALRRSSAEELLEQGRRHDAERTHVHHQLEQLRGRLVRSLTEWVSLLESGLSALRGKTPRVEVMMERAEHVVDAMRDESSTLKGE